MVKTKKLKTKIHFKTKYIVHVIFNDLGETVIANSDILCQVFPLVSLCENNIIIFSVFNMNRLT